MRCFVLLLALLLCSSTVVVDGSARRGLRMAKMIPTFLSATERHATTRAPLRAFTTRLVPDSMTGFSRHGPHLHLGSRIHTNPLTLHDFRSMSTHVRPKYSALDDRKLDFYGLNSNMFEMWAGKGVIRSGMILEGTAAYGGILPDIYIDSKAVATIHDMYESLSPRFGGDVESRIDCAETAVRMLFPKHDPRSFASFPLLSERVEQDTFIELSEFIDGGIGDCRANALALAIALQNLEKAGYISDVEYANRHWGTVYSETDPRLPTDELGEHASLTFKYKGSKIRYVADAYAVQHDRVPLDGPDGALSSDWYRVTDTRKTGTHHNVWAQIRDSDLFKELEPRMDEFSFERFERQVSRIDSQDGDAFSHLSKSLPYPRGYIPKLLLPPTFRTVSLGLGAGTPIPLLTSGPRREGKFGDDESERKFRDDENERDQLD